MLISCSLPHSLSLAVSLSLCASLARCFAGGLAPGAGGGGGSGTESTKADNSHNGSPLHNIADAGLNVPGVKNQAPVPPPLRPTEQEYVRPPVLGQHWDTRLHVVYGIGGLSLSLSLGGCVCVCLSQFDCACAYALTGLSERREPSEQK